jgi:hypothetical protein
MAATHPKSPPKSLRDVVLSRIEQTLRRTFGDEGDVIDDLDLKSDEELLTWYERIVELDLLSRRPRTVDDSRRFRLDPPGFD